MGEIDRIDMGCGSGQDELGPKEVVNKVFELWSTGGFFKNIDLAPDLIASDCKLVATADTKNTDIYKEYTGPAGFMDWITNLTQFDFPDFKYEITGVDEATNVVKVTASYTPTVFMTGKTASEKITDTQEWTVKDNHVQACKFNWGNIALVDGLFETNDAQKVVLGCFGAWGEGKYSDDGAAALIAEHAHADVAIDATADMKNTDGYKEYSGVEGWQTWIEFLSQVEFPDFKVVSAIADKDDASKVEVTVTNTPTVTATKKTAAALMTDKHTWTVTDGKVKSVKFHWGDAAALDALFAQ